MRITSIEKTIIRSSVKKHFGGNADVYLFGSRVDDDRKGGDIDLYITTDMPTSEIIRKKIGLLVDMEKGLGEQKIDVVINNHTKQKPIYEIAEKEGGSVVNDYRTLKLLEAFAECARHSRRMLSAYNKVLVIFPWM